MKRRQFLANLAAAGAASGSLFAADSKPRIKMGQVGTKHAHAAGKLQTILKYPDTFEFVGIVEPDGRRRAEIRDRAPYAGLPWMSLEELLAVPELEAVAVETAVKDLVPTATRCLQAGKHIHLDKPAGDSLEDCKRMHALARRRSLVIQMGYMLRYNPAFQFAHQIVRDGWLGQITEISGMMGKFMSDPGRRQLAEFSGGGMFELSCHLIDQVVSLLGPPDTVTSHLRRTFPNKDTFADNQLAVFDYPKAIATIRCNHIDPMGGQRRQFSITGTEGTFEIRPLEPHPEGRLGLSRPIGGYQKGFQDIVFRKPTGRYDEEFLDFAKVVRGKKHLAWDASHDIATHEAVLRASGMLYPV